MLVKVFILRVVVIFVDVTAMRVFLVGFTEGTDVFGSSLEMTIVTVVSEKLAVTQFTKFLGKGRCPGSMDSLRVL